MSLNGATTDRFDHSAENLQQMALALDIAWDLLPVEADRSDEARRALATIIIGHFERGEHDPTQLGDLAASELSARPGEESILASG